MYKNVSNSSAISIKHFNIFLIHRTALALSPLCSRSRDQIFRQSTELVCRAYGEVHLAVSSPTNTYQDLENLVPRSPQQVQTLLS